MFLLFITFKFLWKNVSAQIKAHLPQHPQALQQFFSRTFLILSKKFLAPPPFKKEGKDYALYMREYEIETIKSLAFYMTDFLFIEL